MAQRILLVDDHEVVRLGIKALLARYEQFQVVAEAGSAQQAIDNVARYRPEVVVMDIRLPGKSGIEATREIVKQFPNTKVIMLTSYAEDELLFEAIAAGASGYVLKQIGSGELVRALETIARGESLVDPMLMQKVFERVRESSRKAEDESFAALTNQELKILALVAEGKTNKEIGRVVSLSEKTVRNYVSSILSKLHLATRSEAAAYAVRHHVQDHLPTT
ncbi:MAG: response regulator transcription factor [Chloroflexi bacterium]|nr:response regulator transcription factor [Chloroflexota bacterium]MBI3740855.1 response regulator transcription factor [Chloroflexota bacterium]